ncbi:hypothetical protein AVEN_44400-1 [Araneus ventricosus]|uniref:Uncharacterized protein n=1 Tax=Araneus ventricosus TaxID=182803 RepID=A0A4Y2EZX2_ARAVE|nr:hypothetical protein AVEN_44400-1 [Araneus ventricosus]
MKSLLRHTNRAAFGQEDLTPKSDQHSHLPRKRIQPLPKPPMGGNLSGAANALETSWNDTSGIPLNCHTLLTPTRQERELATSKAALRGWESEWRCERFRDF